MESAVTEACLLQGTVASFGRGHPPLMPVKQRCGAISADLLESPPSRPSQSRWEPQPAPAQSMPAWQPAAQPPVVTSDWQQSGMAQDSSDELAWEPVVFQWEPAVPQPGRSSPGPGLPGSTTDLPESAVSAAQQDEQQQQRQCLPVFMEEDAPAPAPMAVKGQHNPAPRPAAQQKRMKGATQSWSPLVFISPAQPEEPVPEPETPPEAEATRPKQQAAPKSTAGTKRKHDGADDGEGNRPLLCSAGLFSHNPPFLSPVLLLRGTPRCAEPRCSSCRAEEAKGGPAGCGRTSRGPCQARKQSKA